LVLPGGQAGDDVAVEDFLVEILSHGRRNLAKIGGYGFGHEGGGILRFRGIFRGEFEGGSLEGGEGNTMMTNFYAAGH
jgi:hypothetical protein